MCAPAAKGADADSIAAALRHNSVYDGAASLSPNEERRIEHEIERRDRGRIKIAMVSEADASRAGGVAALANALDVRLGAPGTVVVTAGSRTWLVTSYPDSQAATGVVQQAFQAHTRLVDTLLEAVDGIASIDPGPSRAPTVPPIRIPRLPSVPGIETGASIAGLVVLLVIGIPVLLFALVFLRRRWRARKDARETFEDRMGDVRQQLAALADDVTELDADVSAPGADASAKEQYEQALELYQRAERLLSHDVSPRRLAEASDSIGEGRRLMDAARQSLGRAQAPPS